MDMNTSQLASISLSLLSLFPSPWVISTSDFLCASLLVSSSLFSSLNLPSDIDSHYFLSDKNGSQVTSPSPEHSLPSLRLTNVKNHPAKSQCTWTLILIDHNMCKSLWFLFSFFLSPLFSTQTFFHLYQQATLHLLSTGSFMFHWIFSSRRLNSTLLDTCYNLHSQLNRTVGWSLLPSSIRYLSREHPAVSIATSSTCKWCYISPCNREFIFHALFTHIICTLHLWRRQLFILFHFISFYSRSFYFCRVKSALCKASRRHVTSQQSVTFNLQEHKCHTESHLTIYPIPEVSSIGVYQTFLCTPQWILTNFFSPLLSSAHVNCSSNQQDMRSGQSHGHLNFLAFLLSLHSQAFNLLFSEHCWGHVRWERERES